MPRLPMTLLAVLVLPAALATGCSDTTGPEDPLESLRRSEDLWALRGPATYVFTIQRFCECLQEQAGPVTVEVRNGVVETRRYQTGAAVDPQYDDLFRPVPGLFELVRQAIDFPAAAVAVRYHRIYGFPESIQIDWVAGAVDDEVSYRITDFAPR